MSLCVSYIFCLCLSPKYYDHTTTAAPLCTQRTIPALPCPRPLPPLKPPPITLSPIDLTCGCCRPRAGSSAPGASSSPPRRQATCTKTWGTACRRRPPRDRRRPRLLWTFPGGLGAEPERKKSRRKRANDENCV